jgi:hypothetical protein
LTLVIVAVGGGRRRSSIASEEVPMTEGEPWLFSLATRRRASRSETPLAYDPERQVTVAWKEGRLVSALDVAIPRVTKKADIEKGEDQKDRWRP